MENLSKRDKEKQSHEKVILSAAEKIFCLKGYEDASMDEIAREAKFTKRTVYQYFENKDDLYFAVVLRGLRKLMTRINEANRREPTGYDKLEATFKTYERFYRENREFVGLINYWGQIRGATKETGKNKIELIRFNHEMLQNMAHIIDEGKSDGSILSGQDTEKTAACLMLLITGFYSQLSVTGENFKDFFSEDPEGISFHAIDLVIKPLKRNKTVMTTRKGTA